MHVELAFTVLRVGHQPAVLHKALFTHGRRAMILSLFGSPAWGLE